jgi:UDP-N-acetylmuramoyl-L-alanyl-D-glutamate--2,6-diaminopimelate ligase
MAIKSLIKKILPQSVLNFYHKVIAILADFYFHHPSGKMVVIGVTGTKGKTTTCYLITRILEEAGFKVGMTSTALFKIDKEEWLNPYKMTMLGRFALQRLLKKMTEAGCQYAVIETSSEGIKQFRHLGIEYDVAVFTNLAPEHLEAHGSFEKYQEAKGELFRRLKTQAKKSKMPKKRKKVIVVNADDEKAEYFLQFEADEKWLYGLKFKIQNTKSQSSATKYLKAEKIELRATGSSFTVENRQFNLHLLGEFNIYNSLAALAVACSQEISLDISKRALEKIVSIPGRLEFIDDGQPFKIIIDYAHNPSSFEELYKTIIRIPHQRVIHVFGAPGGGRDKAKRPEMGKIAAQFANVIILTTDDPYEEPPQQIIEEIKKGILETNFLTSSLLEIVNRQEAIEKAIELAQPNDIILITGKGCEQKMAIGDRLIAWDDREVVRKILNSRIFKT